MNEIKRLRAGLLACMLAVTFAPGAMQAEEMKNEAGFGALAALGTLLYTPAKLLYATSGVVFGGIAWGLSGGDHSVMKAVITPALMGDYVLTPAHVRMQQRLHFFGEDPAYQSQSSQTAAVIRDEQPIVREEYPEDY